MDRRRTIMAGLAAAAVTVAGMARAQPPLAVPAAVVSDPAPDAAHPPASRQVLVPSGGVGMNALFYLAGGAGPHPALLLLHGFPGNEQNLDLAQAARRAGWHVLTLHYRGSWGSPGRFTFGGVRADAAAALAYLRLADVQARFGIDPRRIAVAGHSMGGWAAAGLVEANPTLPAFLIDYGDMGAVGARWAAADAKGRAQIEAGFADDLGDSLAGFTPRGGAAELAAHAREWDPVNAAARLGHAPLTIVGAEHALAPFSRALAAAVTQGGGHADLVVLPTDHSFSDSRIALASLLVRWLDALPATR